MERWELFYIAIANSTNALRKSQEGDSTSIENVGEYRAIDEYESINGKVYRVKTVILVSASEIVEDDNLPTAG